MQHTAVAPGAVAPQLGFFVQYRDIAADAALEQLVCDAESHHAASHNQHIALLVTVADAHALCCSRLCENLSSEFNSVSSQVRLSLLVLTSTSTLQMHVPRCRAPEHMHHPGESGSHPGLNI